MTARTLLVAFTAASVACGNSAGEAPSTTTVAAVVEPPTESPPTAPPPGPPPPAPPSPTLPPQAPEQLGKQELRELVAPIALYPDVVLGSLLPATTYPDQVHDAAGYVGAAQRVDRVPDDRDWDGSVVGLLQFPDVLRWLDENPAWTDQMGQAVTYQQGDVLDAIQDYRRAVQEAGNLKSNEYQRVRSAPNRDVYIEPARPDVVYVPSYDPVVATQPQPAPAPGINPWIAFGGGAVVGALGAWALYSIFDDDDDHHHDYYGGRRRIRRYDNYYYARGRRPRPIDWTPRQRPYRARGENWQRPRRLEHRAASTGRPRSAPLRPPTAKPGQRPAQMRREEQRLQRQEHQQQRQDRKQEQRQKQPQRQQQQRQQRQDRRQQQQQQRQQRDEQRREQRQQQQERQQQQRQQQQERRQQQQEQRRQQQGQQREMRQQRQEQRQQQQGKRRERRQEKGAANQEKRKQRQQQNQ